MCGSLRDDPFPTGRMFTSTSAGPVVFVNSVEAFSCPPSASTAGTCAPCDGQSILNELRLREFLTTIDSRGFPPPHRCKSVISSPERTASKLHAADTHRRSYPETLLRCAVPVRRSPSMNSPKSRLLNDGAPHKVLIVSEKKWAAELARPCSPDSPTIRAGRCGSESCASG
jgi:hypothetical protein